MHPVDVLLIEDNIGDEFLVALIVGEAPVPVRLHVALDGVQALFKLAEHGVHPDLVILDRQRWFYAVSVLMLLLFVIVYNRLSKPINRLQTEAAKTGRSLDNGESSRLRGIDP